MNLALMLFAAVELIAPADRSVVKLLPECQREILAGKTLAEREAMFDADKKGDRHLLKAGHVWRTGIPVVFSWKVTDGEKGPWELEVSRKADMSGARRFMFKTKVTPKDGIYTNELPYANYEIGRRYYWRITSNISCHKYAHGRTCDCQDRKRPVQSPVYSFVTEDLAPRWIMLQGLTGNIRDLGGRIGSGGRRIRQGMIFRGTRFEENSIDGIVPGESRLTVQDVNYLRDTLGIKTDLDLRMEYEVANAKQSQLGPDVRYVQRSSEGYKRIFGHGKKIMAENFREFLDERNYPIYFHCAAGADRTGSLAYVLNGILGVDRHGLETDWEATFYPTIPDQEHKDNPKFWCRESHFNDGFEKYGDANTPWNRRIELYLLDCGVTMEEIEKFRSIMLE